MTEFPEHEYIIRTEGLTKRFGFKTVLRNIDLSLKSGEFLSLFGPNGAGKTTLIQTLCSLTIPTSGKVFIAGFHVRHDRESLRKVIGVISHNTFLYDNLSAFENLKFYGKMYDVPRLHQKIQELTELVGLREYISDQVHTYSRGMQQRLSVARAMIHDPIILFLDEPFTGLDQHGAEDFKKVLKRCHNEGKTIIMTSHDLTQGLELCSQAAILKSGTLVYR
ncbi:MAG: heme ABC exporter ATP-binding protein CcmA, partial [Thermodesulfobacteriota bacterium]|nr:heme ABC exporter ATP-binding protein CcmA [Thermodesulfobacteriota bacterium]